MTVPSDPSTKEEFRCGRGRGQEERVRRLERKRPILLLPEADSTMLSVGGARAGGFGRTMRPSDMYRAGGVGCGKQQPIPMWCRCN